MITMHSISEKNLSEAYTLLAVISDPKGCKERLDELYKAVQDAKATVEIANREKAESERLLKEAARVKGDADSWSLRVRDQKLSLEAKESELVSRETTLKTDHQNNANDLKKRLSAVEEKLNLIGDKEQNLLLREEKLKRDQSLCNAMKTEYEEKVTRLKSML